MEKEKLNLTLPAGTVSAWRDVCAELGYTSTTGFTKGQGSPSQLVEDMLAGKLDYKQLQATVEAMRERRKVKISTGLLL